MFTGLIEKTGILKTLDKVRGGTSLTIEHDPWTSPLQPGESVAVNGVCFTVTGLSDRTFSCDALDETLARTTLGSKKAGSRLNMERALKLGDYVGGHFVSGHVDGTARVLAARNVGRDLVLRFECGEDLIEGMVLKGSIACDGVSLTISALTGLYFEVNVIPFTWAHTSLVSLAEGDMVNVETDMLGKYVRRSILGKGRVHELDFDCLRNAGFVD